MNKQLDINFLKEKANCQSRNDQSHVAIISFQRALTIDPKSFNLYFTLGNLSLDQENLLQAENCFRKSALIAPNDTDTYHNWGVCLARQKKLTQATRLFQKVLDANPNNVLALGMIANIFHEQELYKEALETHERVLKASPDFLEAYTNYARTLFEVGDYEKANQKLQKALENFPQCLYIKSEMGLNFVIQQQYEEAIDCFKALIDQNEASPYEWINWSMLLWQQEKEEEAMELFEKGKDLISKADYQDDEKEEIMENYRLTLVSLGKRAQHLSDKEGKIGVQKTIQSIKFILDLLKNTKDKS